MDAIVTSSLRQTQNERIIEKFNSTEFYAIVQKGNTELLDKINYAIDQMNATEGDWQTDLHNPSFTRTTTFLQRRGKSGDRAVQHL